MRNIDVAFWSKVPKEEKSGLITLMVIVSAILIFNFGVTVVKYIHYIKG
jgi:hypothetical protein